MSRRNLTPEFYEQLAADYTDAVRVGHKIYPTLEKAYGVPRSTMARWLKEASRRGLIEPRQRETADV